jgi:methionyl-tRNA synthetase
MSKFYLTTPIYYVNARPHIGHAYTTIVCDAVARWHRMLGDDTYFLTGTDEHGQKIERSAATLGKTPKQLTDEVSADYRKLWDRMGISYDQYIRTTDAKHKRGVQELFRVLRDKGFIYKGSYKGQYCVYDELYVTEGGPGTACPECGRPTETISEENYFFKLSAFADKLLQLYKEHPEFIHPDTRRNEVISFVKGGLRDLSVSRTTIKWGIPVPDDPKHVIYVWLDALSNYATAIGYGSKEKKDQEQFAHYWPADVHMVGKEIIRFHAVYWPAFLMAAGVPVPKSVVAHGWLLFEQSKMSKSRGNIVRAETVLDVLGSDALRYFLMREVSFGSDGSFSFDALVQRYDADLANGLGNLASRTLTMINRYFRSEVPYPSATVSHTAADEELKKLAAEVINNFNQQFGDYQFSRALESAWSLVAAVNKYIVETEPWVVAEKADEESRARLATVLYTSAEVLRIVAALAHPVLPESTRKVWEQLGLKDIQKVNPRELKWGGLPLGQKLGEIAPVFPRAEKGAAERMQQMEEERQSQTAEAAAPAGTGTVAGQRATQASGGADVNPGVALPHKTSEVPAGAGAQAGQPATQSAVPGSEKITIDDFTKVELRVAQVKVAEKVKGADKLLRLEVDLGYEQRQIVAGIAKAYDPEKLIGRKVVIVANLAPRKLRGLESNGMIVAASFGEEGQPVLAGFLEDVPIGSRLK